MREPSDRNTSEASRGGRGIVLALALVCALLVLADLFYDKHGHYAWEDWIGFHAFFGFAAFFVVVMAGKLFRKIVMRREDYYDD